VSFARLMPRSRARFGRGVSKREGTYIDHLRRLHSIAAESRAARDRWAAPILRDPRTPAIPLGEPAVGRAPQDEGGTGAVFQL